MDEFIKDMIGKGLVSIEKPVIDKARKLYSQLEINYYTRAQLTPDIWASWLRMNRRN